jgi:hypothetical protein
MKIKKLTDIPKEKFENGLLIIDDKQININKRELNKIIKKIRKNMPRFMLGSGNWDIGKFIHPLCQAPNESDDDFRKRIKEQTKKTKTY